MINPYAPPSEVEQPIEPHQIDKRPPLNVLAAILFVCISLFSLISGSVIESGEAFLLGLACLTVGKRKPND